MAASLYKKYRTRIHDELSPLYEHPNPPSRPSYSYFNEFEVIAKTPGQSTWLVLALVRLTTKMWRRTQLIECCQVHATCSDIVHRV